MKLHAFGFLFIALFLTAATAQAASDSTSSPLGSDAGRLPVLAGFSDGLYRLSGNDGVEPVWKGGEVKKILKTESGWYLLSSEGIVFSRDLVNFDERNAKLPVKVIKHYTDGAKSFTEEIQDLKDLEVDPYDKDNLVTCTKDTIFYSTDSGLDWTALPSPSPITGLKCVAIMSAPSRSDRPAEITVLASHPFKGLFYTTLDGKRPVWTQLKLGIPTIRTTEVTEEVSDISIAPGSGGPRILFGNSFIPALHELDWSTKKARELWRSPSDFGTVESIAQNGSKVTFVSDTDALQMAEDGKPSTESRAARLASIFSGRVDAQLDSLWYSSADGTPVSLSELWLLGVHESKRYLAAAKNRRGIYLPTYQINRPEKYAQLKSLIARKNLDSAVIDMKDDFGFLRFRPTSPLLKKIGKVRDPIDVEGTVKDLKASGVYLIARIVVFKDQNLYEYEGGKYAAWDTRLKQPWKGLAGEFWVDPYCENVWEYNVGIAKELIARGFDEIQFDYIRFPTDGDNLADAGFRFKDPGMDKESALMSFLTYARENIAAPISIDIYGANGWYRTGVRTGQDVELLQKYVDAVCPMFYPSHFEQSFQNYDPAEKRPYRIYYYGALRNYWISRKRVVVRPYVQAFWMNVSYDRKYYDASYVASEIAGIGDAVDSGYTFWNAVGRYDEVPDRAATERLTAALANGPEIP
jgi:hypothetical protein